MRASCYLPLLLAFHTRVLHASFFLREDLWPLLGGFIPFFYFSCKFARLRYHVSVVDGIGLPNVIVCAHHRSPDSKSVPSRYIEIFPATEQRIHDRIAIPQPHLGKRELRQAGRTRTWVSTTLSRVRQSRSKYKETRVRWDIHENRRLSS